MYWCRYVLGSWFLWHMSILYIASCMLITHTTNVVANDKISTSVCFWKLPCTNLVQGIPHGRSPWIWFPKNLFGSKYSTWSFPMDLVPKEPFWFKVFHMVIPHGFGPQRTFLVHYIPSETKTLQLNVYMCIYIYYLTMLC